MNSVVRLLLAPAAMGLALVGTAQARVNTAVVVNTAQQATPDHGFRVLPAPSADDAAKTAKFSIARGAADNNGGGLSRLNDGKGASGSDAPRDNFFFAAGGEGGRLLVDLGEAKSIDQVSTYSWHPGERAPQVYKLFGRESGSEGEANTAAKSGDLESAGWMLIAEVDTRGDVDMDRGGQVAVSTFDSTGALGKYRYLLLDVSRTTDDSPFGNTFFSEIDVVAGSEAEATATLVTAEDGKYRITIDSAGSPDLQEWAEKELAPVVEEWYPMIVHMLPSEGFEAPTEVSITISDDIGGVAATSGDRVMCNGNWFRQQLEGEAKGAVVHELVHVAQQYRRRGRGGERRGERPPGWLVEGIPDYIRWYLYEPESGGTVIRGNAIDRANYDGSYRVSANFLNYVSDNYGANIVPKLNARLRNGDYTVDSWKDMTGKPLEELGEAWKKSLRADPNAADQATAKANTLTDEEKAAGWKLLFNGENLDGWHSFKRDEVLPGWKVEDGILKCADPRRAGDLCTNDDYAAFELTLEYNISQGGNSGIIYHVTNEGGAAWATGPEFQLEDNTQAHDATRCGWLYALYKPQTDPDTGMPIDATLPAGEWNTIRLVISPDGCVHEVNGTKYVEYTIGSDEFKERVEASKFGRMPLFAKSGKGMIALQGDHGVVSFRNIKVRSLDSSQK